MRQPFARSDWQARLSGIADQRASGVLSSRAACEQLDFYRVGQGSQTVPRVRKGKCHFLKVLARKLAQSLFYWSKQTDCPVMGADAQTATQWETCQRTCSHIKSATVHSMAKNYLHPSRMQTIQTLSKTAKTLIPLGHQAWARALGYHGLNQVWMHKSAEEYLPRTSLGMVLEI